jgi:hypothetical protein
MRDDDGVDKPKLGQPEARAAKRPYAKPRIREYGSIAKLTQSGGSTKPEFGGGMKKGATCL